MDQSRTPRPGQVFDLNITGMGADFEGIAREGGCVVFVPGALTGERVRARVTESRKSFARAQLVGVLEASPDRVQPRCPHYERCGGCCAQHVRYEAALEIKRGQVRDCLARIGGVPEPDVKPVLAAASPFFYRNKAEYAVGECEGRVVVGGYAAGSRRVVEIAGCPLQMQESEALRAAFEAHLRRHGASGVLHLVTRVSRARRCMAIVVTDGSPVPGAALLVSALREAAPSLVSVVHNVGEAGGVRALGPVCRTLYGQATLDDELCGLRFALSPLSFFQIHHAQAEALYALAREAAALTGRETLVDAYCGAGGIALALAKSAARAVGVESLPDAVRDARANAARNGVANARFECARAETYLPAQMAAGLRPDVVTLDPPRAGCERALLDALAKVAPPRVVYVSCNPATLARDVKLLAAGGYEVGGVWPVDMFCQTGHVETVTLLTKIQKRQKI